MIVGAGGHGHVVADIAEAKGCYSRIAFLDDAVSVNHSRYPVMGTVQDALSFAASWHFAVAVGNQRARQSLIEYLLDGGAFLPYLVHPSAVVGSNVEIGYGTVVMAGTVINCRTRIGRGCIVNTGATVDHDNVLEDYVHLSPGVHLAGTVHIGKRSWLGIGSVVCNYCKIGPDCVIGAGAAVCKDLLQAGTYVGVPAKAIGRKDSGQ
ncbi:MAG: acetyltransferase [Eubacteriales bacterium]|nr:acetyltransferase [Eubacteriales bacterium]